MTTYGATPSGFVRPTQAELDAAIDAIIRGSIGDDADTSPHSPFGVIKALRVDQEMRIWDAEEARYHAAYLDTADGVELDRLVTRLGVTRKPATAEQVDLVFTGSEGTVVPSNYSVKTKSGIEYRTTESGQIGPPPGLNVTLTAAAVGTGLEYRVTAGSLTQIVQPLAGIITVSNPTGSVGGNPRETDVELRARAQETATVSAQDVGALQEFKVLLEADPDVRSVYIVENNRSTPSAEGMPANSLQFVVDGGTNAHVAGLIFKYATGGITLYGTLEEPVIDGYGNTHLIKFDRPTTVNVYIHIELQVDPLGWDAGQIDAMKGSIVEIIGGIHNSTEYIGLGTGTDVLTLKLFAAVSAYAGIVDASIALGTNPLDINYASIDILPAQIAYTQTSFISVVTL